MLKSVTVTNPLGHKLKMILSNPDYSGILITNIDGLGAEKANIYTTDYGSIDGSFYNSSRLPERDIDLTLMPIITNGIYEYDGSQWKLNRHSRSIEDHRLKIYEYFPIKQKVTLTFETDSRIAECEGYVATNKPDIFEQNETFAITVTCPDPYFYDVQSYDGITITQFTAVEKQFQFFGRESFQKASKEGFKSINEIDSLKDIAKQFGCKYWDDSSTIEPKEDFRTTGDQIVSNKVNDSINEVTWETSKDLDGLTNGDLIAFVPWNYAGLTRTYLKIGNTTYTMYDKTSNYFTATSYENTKNLGQVTDDPRSLIHIMSDAQYPFKYKNSQVLMILKYSDNRIYVEDYTYNGQQDRTVDEPLKMDIPLEVKPNQFSKYWKHINFGNKASVFEREINYFGDVQLGAKFIVDISGEVRDFEIYNVDTRTSIAFDDEKIKTLTGEYLHSGDQIILNTVKGEKYVRLIRNATTYSLLNCINSNADWFLLNIGANTYSYTASATEAVQMEIRNRTAFIGI